MTSAFIIQVQTQLQPDPNEETAALLRVLIYKIDNTTFSDNIPAVPQWSGTPHATVQAQAILYASLAASLFSAFLAMLGKQWLNRYASIDMQGSAIERSQNRQRKLYGIVVWYFDRVIESLPPMLQLALLLLGCALSRYLWEINTTVASVVLGATSFGVTSYIFFVVAGTASSSCPYQTPGTRVLRHSSPLALSALRSASSHSKFIYVLTNWWYELKKPSCSIRHVIGLPLVILVSPVVLPVCLAIDTHLLARAIVRAVVTEALRVRRWFHGARGLDPQTAALDLQCISWMLWTPLDKTIHLLTLKLLVMMATLTNFDPALVSVCFDILAGCVSIVGGKVVILQGSEGLAVVSALCCLCTLSHLTTVDPSSRVFNDTRRRYNETFPIQTDFEGFPYYHRFCILHNTFHPSCKLVLPQVIFRPSIRWRNYQPSSAEHAILVQLAQFKYQRKKPRKVPRWILHFELCLLSQDPLPSVPVVIDCLSIIATDLDRAVSSATTLDERYVNI